jgi:hypothetical protein
VNLANLLVICCIYGFNLEIGAKRLNSSQKTGVHTGILTQSGGAIQSLAHFAPGGTQNHD